MIFVDASALVSIVAEEEDALAIIAELEDEKIRLCSAASLWETVAGLCRNYMFSVESAQARVDAVRQHLGLQIVQIGEREYELALQAYAQFGKGRHPAGLNMGDCFAYACTKASRATLLFKGDDFGRTDIPVARRKE